MFDGKPRRAVAKALERQLNRMNEDYTSVVGKPFKHFYCPILCIDDQAELCMGHVVNESFPNSSGTCVVQRKDVDSFYGAVAESDFATLVQAQAATPKQVMSDPELSKKMKPRIEVDGEELAHYPFKGHKHPDHAGVVVKHDTEEVVKLVLQKSWDELTGDLGKKWQLVIEKDCRIAAVASLLKAGYLSPSPRTAA